MYFAVNCILNFKKKKIKNKKKNWVKIAQPKRIDIMQSLIFLGLTGIFFNRCAITK